MRETPKSENSTESMQKNNPKDAARHEIDRVRKLCGCRRLIPFARNQTTWELLLLVHICPDLKISQAMGKLKTNQLSYSSLVRFIQEQVAAGNLNTSVAKKRSAKILTLSKEAEAELEDFLAGTDKDHLITTEEQRMQVQPSSTLTILQFTTAVTAWDFLRSALSIPFNFI